MGTRVRQESDQQPSMSAQMEHHFFPPSQMLSPFVTSLWIHRSAPQARSCVLPTGTAQLIVDLSGDGLSMRDLLHPSSTAGSSRPTRDAFPALLHGPDTMTFPLETERSLIQVGVDFKPGGLYPFFEPPASTLQNAHVSLDALWDRQLVADLRERLVTARTLEECARLLEHTLVQQLVRPLRHHPAVTLALHILSGPLGPSGPSVFSPQGNDAHGADLAQIQTCQVAEASGLSSGHFTRVFLEEVGLTPKKFARVQRFRTVLRRMHREFSQQPHQRVNWALVAADCGYYDQPHLIKDFQAFAGICPSAYLRSRSEHSPSILLQAD